MLLACVLSGCISIYLGEDYPGPPENDAGTPSPTDNEASDATPPMTPGTGGVTPSDGSGDDDSPAPGDDDATGEGGGVSSPTPAGSVDADGDGVAGESDCDDEDPGTYPGASEVCGDDTDNDCDHQIDESCGEAGCEMEDLVGTLSVTDEDGDTTKYFPEDEDPIFDARLENTCESPVTLISDTTCYGTIIILDDEGREVNSFPDWCDGASATWTIDQGGQLVYRWTWNRTSYDGDEVPAGRWYTIVASWLTGACASTSIWLDVCILGDGDCDGPE